MIEQLASSEIAILFLALAVLLGTARLLGEIAQRLHQPAVVGEILAGVLLGPTCFGAIAPDCWRYLFPQQGHVPIALHGIATLAVTMFLLVAGLEVDLSTVWKQGRTAIKVGLLGMAVPFVLGLLGGQWAPGLLGRHTGANPQVFSLFLATALGISALPVIAKTLMDLRLYRSDLGMVIISAAMINDLFGWTVFAVILGMIKESPGHAVSTVGSVGAVLVFTLFVLTIGRWVVHRFLPFLLKHTHGPGGVLAFAVTLSLLGAATTEFFGIHAIFGAFLVGIAIGDSSHLREHTRVVIDQFVSFIFAPVFFATIGLKVNLLTHFDPLLTATVLSIACAGKLLGGVLGARWAGLPRRSQWAVGFAMNARGAMEVILGLLALEAGLIQPPLFVALVIMALVTSMMSGPMIRWSLGQRRTLGLVSFLTPAHFLSQLKARDRQEAVLELAQLAENFQMYSAQQIAAAAWQREDAAATGIGYGVAVPHARLAGLSEPFVAVGLSDAGIDFDAPDGRLSHIIFLVLTPDDQAEMQLDLQDEISRTFADRRLCDHAIRAASYAEFLTILTQRSVE